LNPKKFSAMNAMTKTTSIVLILAAALISGCQKWEPVTGIRGEGPVVIETRHVGSFNGLQVDVDANVNVSSGSGISVAVRGQRNILDILETRVINGVLLIQYKTQVWRHERLIIDITVPELDLISSFGSADIWHSHTLYTDLLLLDVFGSGNISIDHVVADNLRSRISGSGNINLRGIVRTQQVNINGSGNYNASALLAQEAVVDIMGSGNSNIQVSHALNASIHGSGSVFYRGNPPVRQTSVFGSGKIVQVQ
jgi:hypothetical protein